MRKPDYESGPVLGNKPTNMSGLKFHEITSMKERAMVDEKTTAAERAIF